MTIFFNLHKNSQSHGCSTMAIEALDWFHFEEILRKQSIRTGYLTDDYRVLLRNYIFRLLLEHEYSFKYHPKQTILNSILTKNATNTFDRYIQENNLSSVIRDELDLQLKSFDTILTTKNELHFRALISPCDFLTREQIIPILNEISPQNSASFKLYNKFMKYSILKIIIKTIGYSSLNLLCFIFSRAGYFDKLRISRPHKMRLQRYITSFVKTADKKNRILSISSNLFFYLLSSILHDKNLQESKTIPIKVLKKIAKIADYFGRNYLKTGKYLVARALFNIAEKYGPSKLGRFYVMGDASLLSGQYEEAECAYKASIFFDIGGGGAQVFLNLGHALLAQGKEPEALRFIMRAMRLDAKLSMSHQNLAAQYNKNKYNVQMLDLILFPTNLLYDAYYLIGERAIHQGDGAKGVFFYGKAIQQQRQQADNARLPAELLCKLEENYLIDPTKPIRILSYEWVTLIGHIAMIDIYIKSQQLGLANVGCQILLLAPEDKVANHSYLSLWRPHITIIENPLLINALFPYQRYFGDCFNAYMKSDGNPADWTILGAQTQISWDKSYQDPLITISANHKFSGEEILKKWGIKALDWFVCLHIRDSGYHRESKHSIQSHRDSQLEDYMETILAITNKGGWVIRVGDKSMRKLPQMEHVIDYPHTPFKSEWMDVFLLSQAKFFIGTTSGLSNVAISLGTPSLLVNCISNYFQLWNNKVLFTLKLLWHEPTKRYLTFSEFTSEAFRWNIFNINRMAAMGIYPHKNSSKEIADATKEMIRKVFENTIFNGFKKTQADHAMLQECTHSKNPAYFGNGCLSESFFKQRQRDLISQPTKNRKTQEEVFSNE